MQNTVRRAKITVSADGTGLVSQAGVLLAEAARVTGLGEGLSGALARWRAPRAVHDPWKILTDLAVAIGLGGDCLADVAVRPGQPAAGRAGRLRSGDLPAGRHAGRGGAAGAESDPPGPGCGPGARLAATWPWAGQLTAAITRPDAYAPG